MALLRGLDTYEEAMSAALYAALGSVAAAASLNARLQWLRDLGILTGTTAERWASCLRVRRRILVRDGHEGPERREIATALAMTRALTTELEQMRKRL